MRIVFMGSPEFAIPSLERLLESHYSVVSIVTVPDKPQGRGQRVEHSPIKTIALQKSIPLLQPADLRDPEFIARLTALRPDVFVVVAFRILPSALFSIPTHGSFNLHASLLPKYRGPAPINWAIINGESETGVTTFFLREQVDTGSVILQARVRIGEDETAGELHDKPPRVGAEIVFQTVRLIELGKAQGREQDNSQATRAPKIFKNDCRIDWTAPASRIHDFIRGLSPTPCAWTMQAEKVMRIYRTIGIASPNSRDRTASPPPGTVVTAGGNELIVQAGEGVIGVAELQQEGRKRMSAAEFLRGYRLNPGDSFV
ncbi:MAG: methionyl-tRNA formyltransferase [Ignavibacteria bacterium]|nr:methionyl-tRNA formyltransferase [Ignavibacteria bacterium]